MGAVNNRQRQLCFIDIKGSELESTQEKRHESNEERSGKQYTVTTTDNESAGVVYKRS